MNLTQDPLNRGIILLFEKGGRMALFLTLNPRPGTAPLLTASMAIRSDSLTKGSASTDKLSIWTGLSWDPVLTPEVWSAVLKNGFSELPPHAQAAQNLLRTAFGVEEEEWLLLVRVGPLTACRGVLALIALKSLAAEMKTVIDVIG